MILNKRQICHNLSQTLEFIFMLILTCEPCVRALSFTWGSWLNAPAQKRMGRQSFHAVRADVSAWIFQSLWNCWQRALLLCGSFSADLKQTALFLHELNGHFKIHEWDVKVNDAVWCGDSLWSRQQSCGPVCPEQRDNSRASRTLRKTACRRNAPDFHWTKLTWRLNKEKCSNSKSP